MKQAEPLSGLTGREFDEALLEAGIRRDRLFMVNAFACTPIEPQRDTENRQAVECCRPLVRHYLSKLPAQTPTLLAGKWAMLSVTGREKGLFATRGFVDREWTLAQAVDKSKKED